MEPTPEDMYAELAAAISPNEILLHEYLLKMFYNSKRVEEIGPILSPDRTYPTIRA